MVIKSFADNVVLQTRRDLLRVHLYFKLIQYGIKPFENDIDIIVDLYLFGGYTTSEDQEKFIDICIQKGLKRSNQSVRNTLSKYTTMGVFEKPKNSRLFVNSKFLPKIECDKLVLQHAITHAE